MTDRYESRINGQIIADEVLIGQGVTVEEGVLISGTERPARRVVLDSNGGLDIDDSVGIGAHSQIWTHIQFGDIVEGCRFYNRKYMHIEKDAKLQELLDAFLAKHAQFMGQIAVIRSPEERREGITCFDVSRRVYTRTYRPAEVAFLKAYVSLIKFTPDGEPPFVVPQAEA